MNCETTTENETYARQSIGRVSRRVEDARDEGFEMHDDFGQVKPFVKGDYPRARVRVRVARVERRRTLARGTPVSMVPVAFVVVIVRRAR